MRRESSAVLWLERCLYVLAAIFLGRSIIHQNPPNFDMHAYAHGYGIMPFQARYMMVPVIRWAESSPVLIRMSAAMKNSIRGPVELVLQMVDAACLIALGWLTPRMRNLFAPAPLFHWLPRWILLWIVAVVYVARYEQAFYVPYDMTALLLFNLAVYFCIRNNLWLYLLTILLAMFNREATVFVLFVWLACNWRLSRVKAAIGAVFTAVYWMYERWQVTQWLGRKPTDVGAAWMINKYMLLPHHWPQLFTVGGFLLLPLLFYRDRFQDRRYRLVVLGMVPWAAAALYFGWWNETRVVGESNVMFACSGAMLLETLFREKLSGTETVAAANA